MPISIRSGLIALPPNLALPAGVTLQAIDGESIWGNTQSNNFYARNAATYANNRSFNGTIWDDPTFFPISLWYPVFQLQSDANNFLGLNLNVATRIINSNTATQIALLKSNGVWLISGQDGETVSAETVGFIDDEPPSIAEFVFEMGNGPQPGRFWYNNYLWTACGFGTLDATTGGGNPVAMTTVSTGSYAGNASTTLNINMSSIDEYWFAAQAAQGARGQQIYGLGSSATADQMARGSNYGDMVDIFRSWGGKCPLAQIVENNDGLVGAGSVLIKPPEMNWAVWSCIIHGARHIVYFYGQYASTTQGFSTAIQGGQTISVYTQAVATNLLIQQLAAIINSPFALAFASVSPLGYAFPTGNLSISSGIDFMVKYYNGKPFTNGAGTFGPAFYIFATTRNSETSTNISATFTVAAGSSAIVIGEGRAIPIIGKQFTDTFANAWTVHIYQVV
jgi:hypothetical protein